MSDIKIPCSKCGRMVVIKVPNANVNIDKQIKQNIICWKCCKIEKFDSSFCNNNCTDFDLCNGTFISKMQLWIKNQRGV